MHKSRVDPFLERALHPPITSARGTVIAAEVAVKNMYHEEPELLPAASGTNTEKGAPPTVGGDEQPS